MIQISRHFYNSLGICQKAGKLIVGTAAVEEHILKDRAKLVLLSAGLSDRTIRKFQKICQEREIKMYIIDDNGSLGKSIGRDDIKIMAINDYNFKKMVSNAYNKDAGVSKNV